MTPEQAKEVETCLQEYLLAADQDATTSVEGFVARLPVDAQRSEFRDLLQVVRYAERQLPPRVPQQSFAGGRYVLEQYLGGGNFGEVWEATDTRVGDRVAIKLLRFTADESWRARIQTEARIIGALEHPNIIWIRDVDVDPEQGVPFVVMALARGPDFAKVVRRLASRGRPPQAADLGALIGTEPPAGQESLIDARSYPRTVARIFVPILRALESAHERGIVHRDLKPGNIVVRAGGHPLLLDFGLASHMPRGGEAVSREQEGLVGTPPYMAPEQFRDENTGQDPRVDVYQLGVVLYEVLCLRRAFDAMDLPTLIAKIRIADFEAPRRIDSRIPRVLEDVVLTAMHVRPESRYASARAFREDLEAFLAGEVPRASRGRIGPVSPRRVGWWMRRHRWPLAFGAVGVAALVVGLEWGFWFGQGVRVIGVEKSIPLGGKLEVKIEAPEAHFLYALVRLERKGKEGGSWVRPVKPSGESAETRPDRWMTTVRKGEHRLTLSVLPEDAQVGDEIVAVLYATREAEWLIRMDDAWATMAWNAEQQGSEWLTRKEAEGVLYQATLPMRGGGVPLRPEAEVLGVEEWKDRKSTQHKVSWRLVR